MTIERRRLYILPTRAGTAFAVLLFFMLVAGLNYTNSLALFLTFLLGGFAVVAMHRCHRNLLGVTVSGASLRPAFAGESARLRVSFDNPATLARGAIECAVHRRAVARRDLPARGSMALELDLPAGQRGVLRIERLKVTTSFPFGLFRAWTWIHAPIATVIYPRARGSLRPPPAPGRFEGVRAHAGIGDDEWLGLRPFRDGDSPRRVAWKAVARGAPLVVKDYGAAADDLRIFEFESLPMLDAEARLEQLARWVVDAEAGGDRYGLRLPQLSFEPDRGPEHRHRCLRALALYGMEPRGDEP